MNCYLSNVPILPLGGKFKMWTFFKQHQFLPDVRIFTIKYYFIPTLTKHDFFVGTCAKISQKFQVQGCPSKNSSKSIVASASATNNDFYSSWLYGFTSSFKAL